jgi:hypothetical protein
LVRWSHPSGKNAITKGVQRDEARGFRAPATARPRVAADKFQRE